MRSLSSYTWSARVMRARERVTASRLRSTDTRSCAPAAGRSERAHLFLSVGECVGGRSSRENGTLSR